MNSFTMRHTKPQVRMYLYYFWMTSAALVCLIVKEFIFSGPCEHLPGVFVADAKAWACGIARYVNVCIIAASFAFIGYFQHIIYSHCEDLAESGGGPELGDLVLNKDHYFKKSQMHSLYSSIEGLAEAGHSGTIGFGSLIPDGNGAGASIFGGTHHEMSYPPRQSAGL